MTQQPMVRANPCRAPEANAAPTAAFAARGLSHCGLVRAHNEDSWFADGDLGLALVADGVGGHANGARASQFVVDRIAQYVRRAQTMLVRHVSFSREAQESTIARAIALTNRQLVAANTSAEDTKRQCGTTIAGLWAPRGFKSPATIFHVGDSRMYLIRNGELRALTRDHSAYQRWLEAGSLGLPPRKNVILQALGLSNVVPEIVSMTINPGDRILLCTDGLTNAVDDVELKNVLASALSQDGACESLVSLGLARGGNDNLTAVLCTFFQNGEAR